MFRNVVNLEKYKDKARVLEITGTGGSPLEAACRLVDRCIGLIENRVDAYFNSKIRKITEIELLHSRTDLENKINQIISEYEICKIQQEIIETLREEPVLKACLAGLKPQRNEVDITAANDIILQIRKSDQASRLASATGQWISERIISRAAEGIIGSDIFDPLIGGAFHKTFTDARKAEEAVCAGQLERSLEGFLYNTCSQVKEKLSCKVAQLVYEMHERDVQFNSGRSCAGGELPA